MTLATIERAGSTRAPNAWRRATLGELCRTTSGGTPSRKRADYFTGDVPWVKSGELTDGLVSEVEEFITNAALASSSAKVFPTGTLLIALYGATVGKLGVLTRAAATNQAVCAIFPPPELDDRVCPYLKLFLDYNYENTRKAASGGVQPNLNLGLVRSIPVPLPPLPEQTRIVAEVDRRISFIKSLDDTSTTNLKQAGRFKQCLLSSSFSIAMENLNG